MEGLDTYTSALVALSVGLLFIAAGLVKMQLVRKPKPVPMRRRRHRS